jgi:hypothetical protein
MAYDLRQYLADQPRALDAAQNRGIEKWVETAHADIVRSALYSSFSEDGEWIVDTVPVPVLIGQYPGKRIGVELLRRRFVMDGWVRAEVLVQKEATHVRLALAGPRDSLIVETVDFGEVAPEINAQETVADAIQRFARTGAVFYPTMLERVAVPPQGIRRIYQRFAAVD